MRFFPALITAVLTCATTLAYGQAERFYHSYYDLSEADQLTLDLQGEVVVEPWASLDQVVVETRITVERVQYNFIENLIRQGRYDIVETTEGFEMTLSTTPQLRRKMMNRNRELYVERVQFVVYLPEDFEEVRPGVFERTF